MERTVERRSSDMKEIIIGSRKSRLALIQTELIADQLRETFPEVRIQVRKIETTGDRRQDLSLDQMGGKGVFIKELDRALLQGEIDLAVHSLKDMPMETAEGLRMEAAWPREDARDVLVLSGRKDGMERDGRDRLFLLPQKASG